MIALSFFSACRRALGFALFNKERDAVTRKLHLFVKEPRGVTAVV